MSQPPRAFLPAYRAMRAGEWERVRGGIGVGCVQTVEIADLGHGRIDKMFPSDLANDLDRSE